MGKQELDNLVKIRKLKVEPSSRKAFDGMLRQQGYRSEDRITVFQTLIHTLGTDNADIQIFLKAHNERNLAEYEGRVDIDDKLLADLLRCTKKLETAVGKLVPPVAE